MFLVCRLGQYVRLSNAYMRHSACISCTIFGLISSAFFCLLFFFYKTHRSPPLESNHLQSKKGIQNWNRTNVCGFGDRHSTTELFGHGTRSWTRTNIAGFKDPCSNLWTIREWVNRQVRICTLHVFLPVFFNEPYRIREGLNTIPMSASTYSATVGFLNYSTKKDPP